MDIIRTAGDGHHADCRQIPEASIDAASMARTMAANVKKNRKKREMLVSSVPKKRRVYDEIESIRTLIRTHVNHWMTSGQFVDSLRRISLQVGTIH